MKPLNLWRYAMTAILSLSGLHQVSAQWSIEETASGGAAVKLEGKLVAEYVIDQANKPYLWPIYGPTGKAMTRAYPMQKVEGEQHDHPHHRGICFGHESANGVDSWAEGTSFGDAAKKGNATEHPRLKALGACVHREYTEQTADSDKAVLAVRYDYTDREGKKIFSEERRMTFRATADLRMIDFDQDLIASEGPVNFADRKDAGLSIRVPTSMSVDKQMGGKIVTSEGLTDKEAWSTSATWCDYHGPVEGEHLGIAILNHPSSFRHPTGWHVRTYGLFTANPFASQQFDKNRPDGAVELAKGERLKLRHRFVFHKGDEKTGNIAAVYEAYAKEAK